MPLRIAFLAAECEPWAKTGGLADVVDALARALGHLSADDIADPVDVFLPRYRTVPAPDPAAVERQTVVRVADPTAPTGTSDVTIVDVSADGYRLRLVDHPPAFDREGFYGDATGDYADNAWRFGLFCRAALEALRADGAAGRRPPSARLAHGSGCDLPRRPLRRRPDRRRRGDPGDAPQPRLSRLGAARFAPPARAAAGRRDRACRCRWARPPRDRDRAGRAGQHGLADLRGRGAHPGLRDGPRRPAALEGRPVLRDPQRPGHHGLGPGDRRGHRRDLSRGPTWPARPPAAPTCWNAPGSTRRIPGWSSG